MPAQERKVKIISYEDKESSRGAYVSFVAKSENNDDLHRAVFDGGLCKLVKANVQKWVRMTENKEEGDQYWEVMNIEPVTAAEAAKTREPEEVGRQRTRCYLIDSACKAVAGQTAIIPDDIIKMAREFEKYVFEQTLVEVAKSLGATELSLLDQFKEACLAAQLDPNTEAGGKAVAKWLQAQFGAGISWGKLAPEAQKLAIAKMKAAQEKKGEELPF